jgi:dienelactone hydrolase
MRKQVIASVIALASFGAGQASAQTALTGTTGPFAVVMEMDPTLPDHTVYRPADMAKVQGKLPVVTFGNGGCINIGSLFQPLLGEIASHGYLVAATGPIGPEPAMPVRPAAGGPPGPPPGGQRPEQSKTEALIAVIDWAIAENTRSGSQYQGKVDVESVAAAGQSCGGLQAIAVGADSRIDTVLVLNSGIIRGGIPTPAGGTRQPFGVLPASEADIQNLHSPVLYLIGGETDSAYTGSEKDFEQINAVPVFNANLPVGHGGTWREPNGGRMGAVVQDWLDWKLKGDAEAAKTFNGDPCGLCANAEWTVKRKNWK